MHQILLLASHSIAVSTVSANKVTREDSLVRTLLHRRIKLSILNKPEPFLLLAACALSWISLNTLCIVLLDRNCKRSLHLWYYPLLDKR